MLMILFYHYIRLLYQPGMKNYRKYNGSSGITLYVVIDSEQPKVTWTHSQGGGRTWILDIWLHYKLSKESGNWKKHFPCTAATTETSTCCVSFHSPLLHELGGSSCHPREFATPRLGKAAGMGTTQGHSQQKRSIISFI